MGFLVHMGHSDASFEQAEEEERRGHGHHPCIQRHAGFHHRRRTCQVWAYGQDVYVEVIADSAPPSSEPQDIFDMKSPDKIVLISDSVKGRAGNGQYEAQSILLGVVYLLDAVKNLISSGVPSERALQFASDNR
jgi:N-acetylglucosamine-6-phosphate deacetylase